MNTLLFLWDNCPVVFVPPLFLIPYLWCAIKDGRKSKRAL